MEDALTNALDEMNSAAASLDSYWHTRYSRHRDILDAEIARLREQVVEANAERDAKHDALADQTNAHQAYRMDAEAKLAAQPNLDVLTDEIEHLTHVLKSIGAHEVHHIPGGVEWKFPFYGPDGEVAEHLSVADWIERRKQWAAKLAALEAQCAGMHTFAKAHERWEANLINHPKAWGADGMDPEPRIVGELYDEFMEVQRLRNAALAKVAQQPVYPTHEEIKAQLAKETAKEMRATHVPASLLHMPLGDSVAQQQDAAKGESDGE